MTERVMATERNTAVFVSNDLPVSMHGSNRQVSGLYRYTGRAINRGIGFGFD